MARRGFTLIELALALTIIGLLLVPLTRGLESAALRRRTETTQNALQGARDALLAYTVHHNGCLPLAADHEGGVPDTDRSGRGTPDDPDTGSVRAGVAPAEGGSGQRAGDLPWADLGLANRALDGQQLRLQYFVASPFTAPRQARAGSETAVEATARDLCPARLRRGVEAWQTQASYARGDLVSAASGLFAAAAIVTPGTPPPAAPWQSFGTVKMWQAGGSYSAGELASDAGQTYRRLAATGDGQPSLSPALWHAVGLPGLASVPEWQNGTDAYRLGELVRHDGRTFRALANAITEPLAGSTGPLWQDLTLPSPLLQTRLGPDVDTLPGSTAASAQNVAVLIAPGRDQNRMLDRIAVRDGNHLDCPAGCTVWSSLDDANVDSRAFSLSPAPGNSPDTVLPISWADYAAALQKAGLIPQPIAW